jgi:tRNA(Arg) A34 adenosine deaminase TadA
LDDKVYLEIALGQARLAYRGGFSPVGAVLVGGGSILSVQYSSRQIGNIYHAELKALLDYQENELSLPDVTLYSTLEPCIMCIGMATVLKVKRVVWILDDAWAGVKQIYNFESEYVVSRFPDLSPVGQRCEYKDMHQECLYMWEVYLQQTGHSEAIQYMLGVGKG